MLRHNMSRHSAPAQKASSQPPPSQDANASGDLLELKVQGEIVGEWLIRLINDQTDYFAQRAFSDSFRCGKNDPELQRQVQYLQAVRDRLLAATKDGELSSDATKISLSVSVSEG